MLKLRLNSFAPIIDDNTRVLILGSMPGGESLRRQQYYGHPRNQFWKIMFTLFNCEYQEDYVKRTMLLREKNIGLWDVIESCYREGSLDADIVDEKVNDFDLLYKNYPNIKYVVFDGSKAFQVYSKRVGINTGYNMLLKKLPSTSPANTMTFQKKLADWEIILQYLMECN